MVNNMENNVSPEMNINQEVSPEISPDTAVIKQRKGMSGSTLKLIAIITMLIDHTAATILQRLLAQGQAGLDITSTQAVMDFYANNGVLLACYSVMRLIGRLGFPLFCFLLVEGFLHTRKVWKYAVRLAIFALISEIPFDLALFGQSFNWNYQNVFFTLFVGLMVLAGFKAIGEKGIDKKWLPALSIAGAIAAGCAVAYAIIGVIQTINSLLAGAGTGVSIPTGNVQIICSILFSIIALAVYGIMIRKNSIMKASVRFADIAVLVAGMAAANLLKTDYSAFGVLTIAVMYGLRKKPFKAMLGGCITLTIMSFSEITCFFTLIPAYLYNGKRGINLKYVFYLFYPVHLFLLYLICYFMKIL
ncbi:MAG: TraX family protein [Mobilitalea sp.]